jgi:tRNA A37 threonylcarbamoyladenosine modification protein TsaB
MSKYTLIIDTSIFGAGVALFGDDSGSIEFLEVSADVADSARELPLMVEAGLKKLDIDQCAITQVLVSQGPGSFTGIRVGMAYAFGFVAGRKLSGESGPRIAGVSSLGFLAKMLVREIGDQVLVLLPATKATGYVVIAGIDGFKVRALDCLSEDASQFFSQFKQLPWVTLGDWLMVTDQGRHHSVGNMRSIPMRSAVTLGLKALGEAIKNNDSLLWSDFESGEVPDPIYLRKSTVEEKALASK